MARRPHLGVSAFKDWFSGLVGPKDQPKQPASQPAVQAPAGSHANEPSSGTATATATLPAPAPATVTVAAPVAAAAPKVAPKRDFLEARQVSLYQLFDSSDFKFDVPPYQRPYAWRTKQVYELLQDFLRAYEARQEYFLGAIVATRAADGAHVPYQLIDGQQRLTSLVLLLSLLHDAAARGGNEGLQARLHRMLYLEADPLEPDSCGRYRLRLRDTDDAFFRAHLLDACLPTRFRLAGLAAAAADKARAAAGPGAPDAAGPGGEEAGEEGGEDGSQPLCNETWWRLYENASFMRRQLEARVAEGLNLQDFTFHVLRNCFVVLMVARDEGASFRIFSSLNGRGMDLSVVDKLKADLLAGDLSPAERSHFADAWAEMESVLGRSAFHRVFDYMRSLAAVRDPWVGELPLLDYFTRKVDDPRAVKQILQVALDYGRLLLQLRQASWAPPTLAELLAETPAEVAAEATAEVAGPDRDLDLDAPEPVEAAEAVAEARAAAAAAAAAAVLERPALALEEVPAAEAVPEAAPEAVVAEAAHLQRLEAEYRSWRWTGAAEPAAEPVVAAAEAADDAAVAEAVAEPLDEPGPAAALAVLTDLQTGVAAVAEAAPFAAASEQLQTPEAVPAVDAAADAAAAAAADLLPTQLQATELPQAAAAPLAAAEVGAPSTSAAFVASAAAASQQAGEAAAAAAAGSEPEPGSEESALLAELDFRSRLFNLFGDEAPLPPLLEFFYQTDDLRHRVAFMKGAEALQLLLELLGDPAAKAARWGRVSSALLSRPFSPEAVLGELALTAEERAEFRARLDSRDLAGSADPRTLCHLLLRCEPPSVAASLAGIGSLHVEKMAPQNAPEGSAWRKTRISSQCDPQAPWPEPWFAASAPAPASSASSASSHSEHSSAATAAATAAAATAAATAATSDPASEPSSQPEPLSYDVKYWYEVQRLHWHAKLGNLVLLPAAAASAAASGGPAADYEARAALWRAAGVGSRLPGFTGPLLAERGRYGRFKFCYDECRQRHADMLEYLTAVFEL